MRLIILSVVFMFCIQANATDTSKLVPKDSIKKSSTLPSIEVKTIDGKKVNIQNYGKTGKITIISFWATWCGPCIKELDNIIDVYEDWQKKYGCELIAITIDDSRNISKVKPFVDGRGWPYTILTDENKDLARALNVNNPPQVLLLDANGNIVYVHNGYTEGSELELEEQMKKLLGL